MRRKIKQNIRFSNLQIVALGYGVMILLGTGLLLLPIASNQATTWMEALFTAVSASCVTGLVVVDTATHWTLFGQLIILLLIQIGGLGFMTFAVGLLLVLRRRVRLRYREVMVESINSSRVGNVLQITKQIIAGTVFFESIGACLLSLAFIPVYGLGKGLYFGIFHSISAFCNAGFDLMGEAEPFSSLTYWRGNALVNLTVLALIVIGGLGFLVWEDIRKKTWHWRRYQLQTKVVLTVSGFLLFGGAGLFLLFEWGRWEMPSGEKILAALFQAGTCRTAGFNTVEIANLSEAGKVWSMVLMFIGGSPGSTAGGIKTTTIAVLLLYVFAVVRHEQEAHFFGRSTEKDVLQKAVTVCMMHLLLLFSGALLICFLQPAFSATDVFFETISAVSTVGMTAGLTGQLSAASRGIIAFLMYCGRVGSISFAVAVLEKRARPPVTFPKEKITIG